MKKLTKKQFHNFIYILFFLLYAYLVVCLLKLEFNIPFPKMETIERKANLKLPDGSVILRETRVSGNMYLYAEINIPEESLDVLLNSMSSELSLIGNAAINDNMNQEFNKWAGYDFDNIEFVYEAYALHGKGEYIKTTIVILKPENGLRLVYVWGGEHDY